MANIPHPTVKNIVLLSDGTGNCAAKWIKTNVWRMYQAVDLTAGDQVALYSNGVGTSGFRPLALLGGAVGLGLKRNVLALYMFACRHYVPAVSEREADRLYAFGFSRGAFTIRVLAGLIADQGLIPGLRSSELERQAKWAYRAYRRRFNPTGGLVGPLRKLRDWLVKRWETLRHKTPYDPSGNLFPKIEFLGLWDTVDAYGLPIDEMTRGWDQWVWPLSLCDQTVPKNVRKLCHAVALDDERHTFHPVLVDERGEPEHDHTDRERVTQVWFAGVHSNVGGGYPDDSLAHVSLRWMASEAQKQGLKLHRHQQDEWASRADPHGPLYNSRRGLGVYYRYNPRHIEMLTAGPAAEVAMPRPKVHASVFQRIRGGRDDYAPIVLPSRYAVVQDSGTILEGGNPYEHPTQAKARAVKQEKVWTLVWLRRMVYFATVFFSLALVLPPFITNPDQAFPLGYRSRGLAAVIGLVGEFLPDFLRPGAAFYQEKPILFAFLAIMLTAFLILGAFLRRRIADDMGKLWEAILSAPPVPVAPEPAPEDILYRLRTHRWYRWLIRTFAHRVFPFLFGLGALAAVVLTTTGTLNRALFAVASASGRVCQETAKRAPDQPGVWTIANFDLRHRCFPTGVPIQSGSRYRVTIDLTATNWRDGSYPVAGPSGFSTSRNPWLFLPALPFRRILTSQWFVPMVRIGSMAAEYHPLDQGAVEFTPRRSGQLFLFVNDAIAPWPFWNYFYDNNAGHPPRIEIRRLED